MLHRVAKKKKKKNVCVYTHTHTQWNITEPPKMKYCHLQQHMDLEIMLLSEVSQKEKGKYPMMSRTCGI